LVTLIFTALPFLNLTRILARESSQQGKLLLGLTGTLLANRDTISATFKKATLLAIGDNSSAASKKST
jgi:hypothetical protein